MKKNPNSVLFRKKILLRMKLTIFLILFCAMQLSASVSMHGQVTLNVHNESIRDVLREIENQSPYRFFYNEAFADLNKRVNINVDDKDINSTMDELLLMSDMAYKVLDNNLVVIAPLKELQQHIVTGRVTDANTGEGLPGVSIVIEGTTTGVTTDIDGNYDIEVPRKDAILRFSYVGYQTQRIVIDEQTVVDVSLVIDIAALDEVIVVGYGTMERRHLTGAVGTVRMDEQLASRPGTDLGQVLYGRIPGVQIINASGRPGLNSTIQIRGINSLSASSTPLLVIDGVPMPEFDLNSINTADIETIDILKDASSAAIYGSRGSNGVILVTTKSGAVGEPILNVNYTYSMQQLIRKAPMMNAAEYSQAMMDWSQNGWIDIGGDPNAPNTIEARGNYRYTWHPDLENPSTLPDTDWQDLAFSITPMHKADISFSGGTEGNTNYYLSGGFVDQEGIMNYYPSKFSRYNINLRANSEIKDWLTIGGVVNSSYSEEIQTAAHLMTYIMQYPPIFPEKAENGYWGGTGTVPGWSNWNRIYFRERGHPFSRPNDELLHNRFNTLGNLFAEIAILPNLIFRSSLNASVRRWDNTVYEAVDRNLGPGTEEQGIFTSNSSRTLSYTSENLLNYQYSTDNHNLDIMAGYEFNKDEYYFLTAQRRNYDDDLVRYLGAGSIIFNANDNTYTNTLISVMSRINYHYNGKYMLSATFRRDGSSRFGPRNKWGNFPSVSAGWRVSDEDFMSNLETISNLKLRASYGFTGNNSFSNYAWISRMQRQRVSFGDYLTVSLFPSSVENPDLAWERTKLMNVGLEFGIINNRIFFEADLYKAVSDNLLLNVPVPTTSGFSSVFTNIGEVQNTGFELGLRTHNLTGQVSWNTQATFSLNRNKITKLGLDDAPMISRYQFMDLINKVGEPIFSFYGYIYEGSFLNQAEIDAAPSYPYDVKPGMGKYKDVNADGIINADDRTIIGNPHPDFMFSLNNQFRYRNFDLSFLWHGVIGNDVYDAQVRRSMVGNQEGRNFFTMKNDRWRSEDNPGDGYHFKLTTAVKGNDTAPSSYWIFDGSFLRLKDITLGYTLPREYTDRIGIGNARLYFVGINLLTLQKSHLIDPENFGYDATTNPENTLHRGIAHNPYPSAKVYSFGLNVEF